MNSKFVNYQLWLNILVVVSTWIIMSVELKIIPLIPSYLSDDLIKSTNRVLLTLAYSFLAAYIFYIITTVLPQKTLINRSKIILSQQVHSLQYELFVIINQILYVFDIKKQINEIEEKDLLCINSDISRTYNGYYATSEYWKSIWKRNKKFTGFRNVSFEFPKDTSTKLSKIPKLIQKIRDTNPNFYVDDTFAEILSSIETNKFIELYGNDKNEMFLYSDVSSYLYKLICDYKRLCLLRYNKYFRNSYHKIHFYTTEEIQNVSKKRVSILARLSDITQNYLLLAPCIVYNNSYDDAKAIIAELNSGYLKTGNTQRKIFKLSEYSIGEIRTPNNCKCTIIIEEKISRQKINAYIKNSSHKIIILIKSNVIFTSSTNKFKNKITSYGVYNIYYRKPLSLLWMHIFVKYPTRNTIFKLYSNVSSIIGNFVEK